jgi:hypothetical protein
MKTLAPMDVEFLANPPESMEFEGTIDRSADDVFDILADPSKLGLWLKDLKSARWLTEPPHGEGSKRRVTLKLITVEERFVVWERGKRFAFVMDATSLPIVEAMGEDMRIDSRGETRCHVTWRVAYAPTSIGRVVRPVARFVFSKLFHDSLVSLKALAERS